MIDLEELLQKAIAASDNGDDDKAIILYNEILSHKEDWSTPNYNLGLIYKYRNDWEKSYKHNKRATELNPNDEAAWWNLGISATMLNKWIVAREAWNHFGMNYELIDEDTKSNVGIAPIRINPNTEGEVIWSKRIDPARSILNNIPYPESNHRYGDLVLNDGAPNGYRMWHGKEYAVFDELQLIAQSDYQTYSIKCKNIDNTSFELLQSKCKEQGIEIENWTETVRMLCKQCSEGRPHENHDHELENKKETDETLIAFASKSEDLLTKLLNEWSFNTGVEFYEYFSY